MNYLSSFQAQENERRVILFKGVSVFHYVLTENSSMILQQAVIWTIFMSSRRKQILHSSSGCVNEMQ